MPAADLTLIVAKQVEEMRKAGGQPSEEALNRLAGQIAEAFRAKKEEVAILRVSTDGKMLSFLFPTKLTKIGYIPLTVSHSLAAKTIREKKGEVVNNFSVYKHPTVFEAVDLSVEEKAAPIQRIVSAPMIADGKVVGVIQVSRKGKPGEPLGPEFTASDLSELAAVGTILGKFLVSLPAVTPAPAKP